MASSLSRRDLFGLFRNSFAGHGNKRWPLRPPGAIDEEFIADTCVRCGACIDVCPRQAIKPLADDYAAGTPHIVARQAPCVLCSGLLCTTVCPSGALRRVHAVKDVRMGLAVLDVGRCLSWQQQSCSACMEHCAVSGALHADPNGRPRVTTDCTGCGICEYYCPTTPAAIQVRPRNAP